MVTLSDEGMSVGELYGDWLLKTRHQVSPHVLKALE